MNERNQNEGASNTERADRPYVANPQGEPEQQYVQQRYGQHSQQQPDGQHCAQPPYSQAPYGPQQPYAQQGSFGQQPFSQPGQNQPHSPWARAASGDGYNRGGAPSGQASSPYSQYAGYELPGMHAQASEHGGYSGPQPPRGQGQPSFVGPTQGQGMRYASADYSNTAARSASAVRERPGYNSSVDHSSPFERAAYESGFARDRDGRQPDPGASMHGARGENSNSYAQGAGAYETWNPQQDFGRFDAGRGGAQHYGQQGYGAAHTGRDYGGYAQPSRSTASPFGLSREYGAIPGEMGQHASLRGRGPKNYTRSDERVLDDLHERLASDPHIDATDVEVRCQGGTVVLEGTVEQRWMKHRIEDLADACGGVRDIDNRIRVAPMHRGAAASRPLDSSTLQGASGSIASSHASKAQDGPAVSNPASTARPEESGSSATASRSKDAGPASRPASSAAAAPPGTGSAH